MKWEKFDLGKNMKEDLLETAKNDNYKFQAQIIKKVHIYGERLFGDFDIILTVFQLNSNNVETFKIIGLNGNFKGAKKQLIKLKEKALIKYSV